MQYFYIEVPQEMIAFFCARGIFIRGHRKVITYPSIPEGVITYYMTSDDLIIIQ